MLNIGKSDKVNVRNTSLDNPRSLKGEKEFDNPTLAKMTRELKGGVPNEAEENVGVTSWIIPEEFERVMNTGLPPKRENASAHVPPKKRKEKMLKKKGKKQMKSKKRKKEPEPVINNEAPDEDGQ